MAPRHPKQPLICQLHITLAYVKPPIWRRIAVPHTISLDKLSLILQKCVGWSNVHLHEFTQGEARYGMALEELNAAGLDILDERKFRLCDLVPQEKMALVYTYDMGDDWQHDIVVEKIAPPEQGVVYPLCLDGARACPPEDCGGPGGYEAFLQAILDESHPDHVEMLEWVGGLCDPEEFDLEYTNDILR